MLVADFDNESIDRDGLNHKRTKLPLNPILPKAFEQYLLPGGLIPELAEIRLHLEQSNEPHFHVFGIASKIELLIRGLRY